MRRCPHTEYPDFLGGPSFILGNAYHGDASVAIAKDGQLIAAVGEERFNRCGWNGFEHFGSDAVPHLAVVRRRQIICEGFPYR